MKTLFLKARGRNNESDNELIIFRRQLGEIISDLIPAVLQFYPVSKNQICSAIKAHCWSLREPDQMLSDLKHNIAEFVSVPGTCGEN